MAELKLSLKLVAEADRLLAPLKEVSNAISDFSKQTREQLGRVDVFKGLQAGVTDTATKLDAAKIKLREASQQLIAAATPAEILQAKNGYAEALRGVKDLTAELGKQKQQLGEVGNALTAAGVDTRRLAEEQRRLQAISRDFEAASTTMRAPARIISPAISPAAGAPPAMPASTSANGAAVTSANPFITGIMAQAGLKRELEEIHEGIRKVTAAAPGMGQALGSSARPMRTGVESISQQLSRLQNAVAAFYATVATLRGVGGLIQIADGYALVEARIRQGTESQQEFEIASADVFAIAQESRAPLEAVGNLYARLSPALREQGKELKDVAMLTRLATQASAVSGATTAEQAGSLNQLSQALASGTLRGDEFNSVNEQAPRLMKALADGLGVSRGELRKYAEEGKLTTEFVTRALSTQAKVIEEEFSRLPVTVSGAMQTLKNEFQKNLGELNQSSGATAGLSQLILGLARNLGTVLGVAFSIATAAAANWALSQARGVAATNAANAANNVARLALIARAEAAMADAAAQNLKAQADLRAAQAAGVAAAADGRLALAQATATAAAANLAAAQTTVAAATATAAARVSLASRLMGALGGPVGIAITALTALAGWWLTVGQNAESAGEKQAKAFAGISGKTIQTLKSGGGFSDDDIKELYDQVNTLREAYNQAAAARKAALERTQEKPNSGRGIGGARFVTADAEALSTARDNEEMAANALIVAEQLLERAQARRADAAAEQEKLKRDFASFTGSTSSETASVSSREQTIKARYELEEQAQKISLDRQQITESQYLASRRDQVISRTRELITLRETTIEQLEGQKKTATDKNAITRKQSELRDEISVLNIQREQSLQQITLREEQVERESQQRRFQLQVEYLERTGQSAAAAALKSRQALASQLRDLGAVNNAQSIETEIKQTLTTLGADISNADLGGKLVAITDVESALSKAEIRIREAQTRLSTRREGIQTSVQTKGISEAEGEALNNQAAREFVDEIAPEVQAAQEELNNATVSPEVRQSLQQRIDQLQQLLNGTRAQIGPTTEWGVELKRIGDQVKNNLADGLANAFVQVSDGSKTAKEAFRDFARSTLSLIAQLIVRALVLKAIQATISGFSSGGEVGNATPATGTGGNLNLDSDSFGLADAAGVRRATGGDVRENFLPGGTVRGPGTGTSDSIPAWLSNGEYVINAASARKIGTRVLDQINRGDFGPGLTKSPLLQRINQAMAAPSPMQALRLAFGGIVSRAGRMDYTPGGTVRGPGTGTSDSIPAWLSNGEYVIKEASVRKIGTRFLDALNGNTLPRPVAMRAVAEKTFAQGGLVGGGRSDGAGAEGMDGAAASARPVNVTVQIENYGPPAEAQKGGNSGNGLDQVVKFIVRQAKQEVARDVRVGGEVRESLQTTFGLNPAVGATR